MLKTFLLLAGLPLYCHAQSASHNIGLYAGARLSLQTGQPFNAYSSARLGPAVTVGAQFNPRLALQLSTAYTWRHGTYQSSFNDNGQVVIDDYDTRLHTFTVPVLLRVTLTKPASRWHVDALVGPTLLFYYTHQVYLQTAQGQVTRSGTNNYLETQAELSLGPSLRYSLTPQVELVADALASYYISGFPYSLGAPFSSQLSSHVLFGLQYRFKQGG